LRGKAKHISSRTNIVELASTVCRSSQIKFSSSVRLGL